MSTSAAPEVDRPHGWTADIALTAFFLLATVFPYFLILTYGYAGASGWLSVVVGILIVTPLVLRSHYPMLMVALATIGGMAHLLFLTSPLPCLIVVPVMVYSVARWVESQRARGVLVLGGGASALGPMTWAMGGRTWEFNTVVLAVLVCLSSVLTPYVVGRRVRETELARVWAHNAQAEHYEAQLEEQARETRMAEINSRNQIARELHDIVAHSLSVMIVQAEGGRALATKKPERAAEVLETIAETGREALTDIRRIVGVLRSAEDEEFTPMPGFGDITDMVERAGERVHLSVEGDTPHASQGLQLTVFRVVQEAITNFLKHAGPDAECRVVLLYHPDEIEVRVTDDGTGAPGGTNTGGHGLQGMSERVTAMGGTLSAGPRASGGFQVRARLPLTARAQARGTGLPPGEDR